MRRRGAGHGDDRGAPLIDLHVEERGSGFPLLLITGLGDSNYTAQAQWAAYAKRRRVLALDNRGTGLSEKPPGPYTIELMADDAASVLDAREFERADVYGYSMGGYIALALAVRRPDLVRSLVLACTGPGGPDHEPPPPETIAIWMEAAQLPREQGVPLAYRTAFTPGWIDDHPQEYDGWVAARLDPPTPLECWLAQSEAAERYRETGVEVELIDVPALVVHGELDAIVPVSNARLLAARIPRAELVELPGRGHAPMLEEPQAFGQLVCSFLDRIETSSA